MPALGMILIVILGIMILAGAAYWTWKLEVTGNADDVVNAIGGMAKASGELTKEPEKLSKTINKGILLVGAGVVLYLLLSD